jgi:DNA-binding MarR family transcriptional regulator
MPNEGVTWPSPNEVLVLVCFLIFLYLLWQVVQEAPRKKRILEALAQHADGWFLGRELSHETGIRASLVYVLLDRLEQDGFVETRHCGPSQLFPRREYQITEAGLAALEQVEREKEF